GVLVLAGAGQAAPPPSAGPTISGVLAGVAAPCLGAPGAFCGAHFPLRRARPAMSPQKARRRLARLFVSIRPALRKRTGWHSSRKDQNLAANASEPANEAPALVKGSRLESVARKYM